MAEVVATDGKNLKNAMSVACCERVGGQTYKSHKWRFQRRRFMWFSCLSGGMRGVVGKRGPRMLE